MSGDGMGEMDARRFEELSAYHDGELSGLARWRFERRLRREPGLRRELAALSRLSALVRESEPRAPAPDLWDRIAAHLPAVDARRREAEAGAGWGWGWGWRPLGAVAAAAALAAVVVYSAWEAQGPQAGAVRWMDSGGRSVMVLEEPDMTVIWMLDDAAEGAARGGSGEVA
jgi:anti-sigma-K factor RskA